MSNPDSSTGCGSHSSKEGQAGLRTRRLLPLPDKLSIVASIESGKSIRSVSRNTGVPRTTVQNIYARKHELYAAAAALVDTNFPTAAISDELRHESTEQALLTFLRWTRDRKIVITKENIRQYGIHFANNIGYQFFLPSPQWIDNFLLVNQVDIEIADEESEQSRNCHQLIEWFESDQIRCDNARNDALKKACRIILACDQKVRNLTDNQDLTSRTGQAATVARRLLVQQNCWHESDDEIVLMPQSDDDNEGAQFNA